MRQLLTAMDVAKLPGIHRDAVYRRADERGAVRRGTGPKAKLRLTASLCVRSSGAIVSVALSSCSGSVRQRRCSTSWLLGSKSGDGVDREG
jgi:hypothetical protein